MRFDFEKWVWRVAFERLERAIFSEQGTRVGWKVPTYAKENSQHEEQLWYSLNLFSDRGFRSLRLATPRHRSTVCTPARRARTTINVLSSALFPTGNAVNRWHLQLGHINRRLARGIAPLPPTFARLPICRSIETNKQQQIAAQDRAARDRGKLLAGAVAKVGHPVKVGAGEVGVGGEIDEAEVDDELHDLQARDPLLPPDADAARGLEVVPVHDDVHEQVEGDGHPGDGGEADELGVAEEGGGAVVVGVEESWRKKEGVSWGIPAH